jgi:hypothetical protein
MDLAKIVLESVRKDGHLRELFPAGSPGKDASGGDADAVVLGAAEPPAADVEDVDTISSAANCSCNNPTQTVASSDSLLQVQCTRVCSVCVA